MGDDTNGGEHWSASAMWWHVYPLGFTGAPIRDRAESGDSAVVHRLPHIEAWLDHVIELGLNGIALGPVFASSTHGYDTIDHLALDPRLGDDADFGRLITAAHERGIRVLLDGVFNHVGSEHPAFLAAQADPSAPEAALFRLGEGGEAEVFEGHGGLVELDHDSPAVEQLVVDVMGHWLARGADGWRLDAAYAVPSAFWAKVLPRVREQHPDAWFLGEVIHGDYAEIVRESTMDAVTQYELWQGIWHSIAERNLFELEHAIGRGNELLRDFVPYTFVGNHDVTRIASAVGTDFVPHALAVLCTVAGTPAIFAGDEFGWQALKEEREGGDDAIRPEFPADPPAPDTLDPSARHVLDVHRELLALRRRNPWLTRAHTDAVHVANGALVLRTAIGDAGLVTALNLDDEPVTVPAADASAVVAGACELGDGELTLPPRGWAVLEVVLHD
ncbi:alpha-amylase family glycosyl hydrolase [Agrococcus sp. ARC_14]|uniref:alpha-amylase family glycosyl hydrolase n=1 Tax=Agrococcus sp. ARC_14 TaxID=2919927 RepID=UPI001F0681D1|nr:alpha-amylase family glycosyl hydrolase [Agrococcus sp. ARC_14]MCH1883285.1 alpha-amylase family glycosyl hydrolase [Agrococcus sp. ARC_14]